MTQPCMRVAAFVFILLFIPVTKAVASDRVNATFLHLSTDGNLVSRDTGGQSPPLPMGSWRRTTFPGSDWANSRGAIMWRNRLFHADDLGNMWINYVSGGDLGPRRSVDMDGVDQTWDLSRITGMYYLPSSPQSTEGRVYYTMEDDSRLLWREFDPSVSLFGDQEYVVQDQADIKWSDVRGMNVNGGYLYFGRSNDYLYRAALNDEVEPVSGSTVVVDDPAYSATYWGSPFLTGMEYARPGTGYLTPPAAGGFASGNYTNPYGFRFKKWSFTVEPDRELKFRAIWGPERDSVINVFVRDPSGQLVASDTSAPTPNTGLKWLTAPAGSGGLYTLSVMIKEGYTNYYVTLNHPDQPAGPRADHEFTSRGGSWEVYGFDVDAGDPVTARIIWEDSDGREVRVFLRDETGTQVARSINLNGSPKAMSAVASNSGRWSVAVRTMDGPVNYEVLVDTWSNR